MSTVITIDRAFIIDRLNHLPPHSRLRAGYCDLMKHMRRAEMAMDHMTAMLNAAMEDEVLTAAERARIEESY